MRGLRRGIGLYINEVSSPTYRREVQRLASKYLLTLFLSFSSSFFFIICNFFYIFNYLVTYLFIYLLIDLFIYINYIFIYLLIYLFIYLFIYICIYLFINLFVCSLIYSLISFYLFIFHLFHHYLFLQFCVSLPLLTGHSLIISHTHTPSLSLSPFCRAFNLSIHFTFITLLLSCLPSPSLSLILLSSSIKLPYLTSPNFI